MFFFSNVYCFNTSNTYFIPYQIQDLLQTENCLSVISSSFISIDMFFYEFISKLNYSTNFHIFKTIESNFDSFNYNSFLQLLDTSVSINLLSLHSVVNHYVIFLEESNYGFLILSIILFIGTFLFFFLKKASKLN